MMPRRLAAIAVAVAMIVLLPGCSGVPEQSVVSTSSSPMPTEPVPEGALTDEHSGETSLDSPIPAAWDDEQRAAAVRSAVSAMSAFARPQLNPATWWAELSPLLTPQAQIDYQRVDPARIPVHAVTGAGTVTDEESTYVAVVSVPTDVGVYLVTLIRADGEAPWLASRFTPPEGVN